MEAITNLDLLLIGKTGNGKSATGNSILKRHAFESMSSTGSVTTTVNSEVTEYRNKIIKVVDGPGVGDTRLDTPESMKMVMKSMEHAIEINPMGYHAFLLVTRFGGRFTKEDIDTINVLKSIFGRDFVQNYCILIMTCGDNFENERSEKRITFTRWCHEQDGVFKELLAECKGRVVLFNNVDKKDDVKNAQLDRLLALVNGLETNGRRYTDAHFERAQKLRKKLIVESKKPVIWEEIIQETSLIQQRLQHIRNEVDLDDQPRELENLKQRTDRLLARIEAEDKGTNTLKDLIMNVEGTRTSVENAGNLWKIEQERQSSKDAMEDMSRRFEEQMRIQREDMRQQIEKATETSEKELKEKEMEHEMKRLEHEKEMAEIEERREMRQAQREILIERMKQDAENKRLESERQDIQMKWMSDIVTTSIRLSMQFYMTDTLSRHLMGFGNTSDETVGQLFPRICEVDY